MTLHAGAVLRTDTGETVVVWSAAPGWACYWAHVTKPADDRRVVKVRVWHPHNATTPTVKIVDE